MRSLALSAPPAPIFAADVIHWRTSHAQAYRTASRLFPGSHIPWLGIGMEYLRTNHLHLALQYIKQAQEIAPREPLVLHELGALHYFNGDYDEAISYFLQVGALERRWDGTGTTLERHWNDTGTALERRWNGAGTALERHWNGTGTALERHWNGSCDVTADTGAHIECTQNVPREAHATAPAAPSPRLNLPKLPYKPPPEPPSHLSRLPRLPLRLPFQPQLAFHLFLFTLFLAASKRTSPLGRRWRRGRTTSTFRRASPRSSTCNRRNRIRPLEPLELLLFNLQSAAVLQATAFEWASSRHHLMAWLHPAADRGHAYRKKRDFDNAIKWYSAALAINPRLACTYSALGFTYHLRGDLHMAIQLYHQSLSIKPDDTFTYAAARDGGVGSSRRCDAPCRHRCRIASPYPLLPSSHLAAAPLTTSPPHDPISP